jgi:recombinational DNA repair ATPase RecF
LISEFEKIRYPLVLHKKPYQPHEWQTLAKSLKAENHRLKKRQEPDLPDRLESQLCGQTAIAKEIAKDRERTILELKRRIKRLKGEDRRSLPSVFVDSRKGDRSSSPSSTGSWTASHRRFPSR